MNGDRQEGDSAIAAARRRLASDTVAEDLGVRPASAAGPPPFADALRVVIAWAGEEPLLRGRAYELTVRGEQVSATVAPIHYRLNEDGRHLAAKTLSAGEVGVCDIELSQPLELAEDESFTLLDAVDASPIGAGRIQFALRRSQNVQWQPLTVDRAARAARAGQRPAIVWLTGLSGAGKSTIANLVEFELHRRGHATYVLDGDNVRHGLNSDLGFTAADRVENIRRVAEVAALMADAGLIVVVSFISPFRTERLMARSLVASEEFFEIHVDAPLQVVEARDPKGLYGKARRGELTNFTGIDSPYESPAEPELHLRTDQLDPAEAARAVIELLAEAGRLTV